MQTSRAALQGWAWGREHGPYCRAKPSIAPGHTGGSAQRRAVRNPPPHQAHRCHWEGLLELRERWVAFYTAGIAIWKDLRDSPWLPSKEC